MKRLLLVLLVVSLGGCATWRRVEKKWLGDGRRSPPPVAARSDPHPLAEWLGLAVAAAARVPYPEPQSTR